jgi:hypothetical protein
MIAIKKEIRQLISAFLVCIIFISCQKNLDGQFLPPDPEEFFNYSIGTTNYSYSTPSDTIRAINTSLAENQTFAHLFSVNSRGQQDANLSVLSFVRSGMALNSDQQLHIFGTTNIFGGNNPLLSQNPINVHITEYGQVGEFIAGNFQGILFEAMHQTQTHAITCSFRVRRVQ